MAYIIEIENLKKEFKTESQELVILENVNLRVSEGEKIGIVGPSGSGKSTLLSLLAGLDKPSSGKILAAGKNLSLLNENELAEYRNKQVSVIFQSFELISPFTALENASSSLDIRGEDSFENSQKIATEILEAVGLSSRKQAFPKTLSGGEKQRVAIARALASNAEIILADEPTGSLDRKTGEVVLDILLNEVKSRNKTLIIITHDLNIAKKMDRIFEVKNKQLYEFDAK